MLLLPATVDVSRLIRDGDLVVVYERFDSMKAVDIKAEGVYQNKWGRFLIKDWIGKPYGSKVAAATGGGWVSLLAPTPELWSMVLRHRTQILYVADIAMVCFQLDLRPGCTVLESGTGSGSLTTSLARAVAPTGRVRTFEFHEQRAELARADFEKNGLGPVVVVEHRNVEQDGFPAELHESADAVFLDLPGPWKAVPAAAACLRLDGGFCSFSPCIEQVQRTCAALNANGFREIRTMEVLVREYEVSRQHVGLSSPDGLLVRQCQGTSTATKRPRLAPQSDREDVPTEEGSPSLPEEMEGPANGDAGNGDVGDNASAGQDLSATPRQVVVTKPVVEGRGHTGYLTFARKAVPL